MDRALRVLIVEDNPAHAHLWQQQLGKAGYELECRRVQTEDSFLTAIHNGADLILAEYRVGNFGAIRAMQLLADHAMQVPLIVISAHANEDDIAAAIGAGAEDYLLKDRLSRLGTVVKNAMDRKHLRESGLSSMHQVLGVVAHEMRTPLAGLRAISEVLMTHRADSEQHLKFTRRMNEEVVRLSNTVNDLLESARQNSGHANWIWSPFAISEIARQAMESIRPLVDERAIALAIHVDAKHVEMNGDAAATGRLILNLLSNAAKHTSRGSITLRVKRHTDSAGRQWIRLAVRDTGAGILPEMIPHLGRPFALNKGIVGTQSLGGSGVGLSLCRGIAEAHGGTLTLHSVPGRGTLATVQLRADLTEAATTRCKIDLSISPLNSSIETARGSAS